MESIQAQSTQEPTEFTDGMDDGGRITAAGALDALVDGVGIPRGTVILAATPIGNTADASARLIAHSATPTTHPGRAIPPMPPPD